MTSDASFQALAVVMLALAAYRHRDAVTITLAVGFVASLLVPMFRTWPELIGWMSVIDGAACAVMAAIWAASHNMRAWAVGFVGLFKTVFTLSMATPYVSFYSYALALNCAYLLQVAIAGGFIDAIGNRLDALCRWLSPRGYSLFRDGHL